MVWIWFIWLQETTNWNGWKTHLLKLDWRINGGENNWDWVKGKKKKDLKKKVRRKILKKSKKKDLKKK